MKKEFTEDQLIYIRDVFDERCEKYIQSGKREDAQDALDIVDVIQSKLNCDEYGSLETYLLNRSGTYAYIEKRMLEEKEEEALKQMVEYAKSSDTEPSKKLKDSINDYLNESWDTIGLTPQSVRYKIIGAINRLIVLCMKSCTDDELKKLDAIVTSLAEDRRN